MQGKAHLSLGIAQWLAIRSTATGRVTCLTAGAQSYSSYVCARSSRTNAIRSSQVTGSQLGAGLEYYARNLQFERLAAKKLLLWKTVNSSGLDCRFPMQEKGLIFLWHYSSRADRRNIANGMGGMHAWFQLFYFFHTISSLIVQTYRSTVFLFFSKVRQRVCHELSFVRSLLKRERKIKK